VGDPFLRGRGGEGGERTWRGGEREKRNKIQKRGGERKRGGVQGTVSFSKEFISGGEERRGGPAVRFLRGGRRGRGNGQGGIGDGPSP